MTVGYRDAYHTPQGKGSVLLTWSPPVATGTAVLRGWVSRNTDHTQPVEYAPPVGPMHYKPGMQVVYTLRMTTFNAIANILYVQETTAACSVVKPYTVAKSHAAAMSSSRVWVEE